MEDARSAFGVRKDWPELAQILEGASGGMFRVQFGSRSMTSDETAALLARLQKEKIVNLAVAAP